MAAAAAEAGLCCMIKSFRTLGALFDVPAMRERPRFAIFIVGGSARCGQCMQIVHGGSDGRGGKDGLLERLPSRYAVSWACWNLVYMRTCVVHCTAHGRQSSGWQFIMIFTFSRRCGICRQNAEEALDKYLINMQPVRVYRNFTCHRRQLYAMRDDVHGDIRFYMQNLCAPVKFLHTRYSIIYESDYERNLLGPVNVGWHWSQWKLLTTSYVGGNICHFRWSYFRCVVSDLTKKKQFTIFHQISTFSGAKATSRIFKYN